MSTPSKETLSPVQRRFREAICDALSKNVVTQSELATQIGMSASLLNMKVQGVRPFTFSEAVHIAEVLGISIDSLNAQ